LDVHVVCSVSYRPSMSLAQTTAAGCMQYLAINIPRCADGTQYQVNQALGYLTQKKSK
jgi:hypothetical protein